MFITKSMKKNIAIYLSIFSLLFIGASCSSDDDNNTNLGTPYAFISSFSIDNIVCPFHDITIEGNDTVVERTVSGDEFKFVVDQRTKEIYNIDSLTFGTKVDKVVTSLSYTGVPYRYDAGLSDYVYYYSVDSLDFTSPVNVRVTSTDGTYENYYTIKLNVHQVDPELLVWDSFAMAGDVAALAPCRLIEKDGTLYLFGKNNADEVCVAVLKDTESASWELLPVNLPLADVSSVQLFKNSFYLLAGGVLYVSADAKSWVASANTGLRSLLAVSDENGKMWAATDEKIVCTTDGVSFVAVEDIPENFPLYGCSSASYPLVTNDKIYRTMLIGYADEAKSGGVKVWSKLSTEDNWCAYEQSNSEYMCPPLAGLQVLYYDNALFAVGGAAVAGNKNIEPFGTFYISKDNGIAWRVCKDYNLKLPAELKGCTSSFAAAVTADDYMWIITPDAAWRGRINRLGF